MGSIKERYLDSQENQHIQLARALGISWSDLCSLNFDLRENISLDGMVYGYIVDFSPDNDENLLRKIKGLDDTLSVYLDLWALERTSDEEYELDAISENTDIKGNFYKEIQNIENLFEIHIEDHSLRKVLLRQLFISIIGAMETYLSDMFINEALSEQIYVERFVESHPDFKKQKIQMNELFSASKTIREKAKNIMLGTIYHKLPTVKEMYEATFHIQFPDISKMQKYIIRRHDLVHRNGKTKSGKSLNLTNEVIIDLKMVAIDFVEQLSKEMENDIPF